MLSPTPTGIQETGAAPVSQASQYSVTLNLELKADKDEAQSSVPTVEQSPGSQFLLTLSSWAALRPLWAKPLVSPLPLSSCHLCHPSMSSVWGGCNSTQLKLQRPTSNKLPKQDFLSSIVFRVSFGWDSKVSDLGLPPNSPFN